jgi:hypothetical protein
MTVVANPLTNTASRSTSNESFATVLHAAIDASGLGLARIHDHLKRRGVSVSIATLSYWQNGHSVPGRRSTLAALAHLEDVLHVAPGSLTTWVPRAAKFGRNGRSARSARPDAMRQIPPPREAVTGSSSGAAMASRPADARGSVIQRRPPAA